VTIPGACAGTYSRTKTWKAVDACGNESGVVTQIITVNDNVAPQIVDVADVVLSGCNPSWPSLSSTWTDNCSTGGIVAGVAGNIVQVNATTQSRVYTFTITDLCGNPDVETTLVTRTFDATVAPTSINATVSSIVTGGSTTLSVVGSLAAGATWNWFSGSCGGTSIGTGASIVVSPTANTTYYVRAQGSCVTTACVSKTISVTQPCGATSVSSNATANTICSGSNVTLSVVGSTGTGGNWKWYKSGCGSGTCAGTGASISVAPTANTTYFVRSEGGTCGTTSCMSIAITVNSAPAQPSTITGTATGVCGAQGRLFTVTNVAGVSYTWYVPGGATIVSGQGTNSITVNFGTSLTANTVCGGITVGVKAGNGCGFSTLRTLTLTSAPVNGTAAISGAATIMTTQTTTYTVGAVAGATNYTWVVPAGWSIVSGQGTTSLTVTVGSTACSTSIKVTPSNSCGNAAILTKSVTVNRLRSAVVEEEVEETTISIYPNPAKDVLYLNTGSYLPTQVQIFDMVGNKVYDGNTATQIDLNNLTNGMYLVRIQVDGKIETKRLQVVR